MILPVSRILKRFELDKADSDVAAFFTLLYAGEVLTKLTVAGILAGVDDDRDHHRYGHEYNLVRADGIGDWRENLDAILTGPTSQFIAEPFRVHQRALTQKFRPGDWQNESVRLIRDAVLIFAPEVERQPETVALRQWFNLFCHLRNKTRGHGAPSAQQCSDCIPKLEESIRIIAERLPLFNEQWAYLHQNYSRKYRVAPITDESHTFDPLRKQVDAARLIDGVYINAREFRPVTLLVSDPETRDFFFPNGQFNQTTFEAISYETGERRRIEAKALLQPPAPLPSSDTEGASRLEVVGRVHSNLPPTAVDYVARPELERRLTAALTQDRHEIVTLAGPGGIGKTSLALAVLHSVARYPGNRFEAIIWLSARDIDLLPSGPKPVRPHGVSIEDFAGTFAELLDPKERNSKEFKKRAYFANSLSQSPIGPLLVVFDNFETVVSPSELYRWIDSVIRSPNKILITTRTRDFAGDLPIEVSGMDSEEAGALIERTADALGIRAHLTDELQKSIFEESGGHPYIIKILLGEVAREGRAVKPARIIASQEQLLTALFERTYVVLSPVAQRVFLLLCSWKSTVPAVGIEAVLMRSAEELVDIRASIDELRRLSLIEEFASTDSDETLLNVPLAAMAFGRRKLSASHLQAAVEADVRLLQGFGAFQRSSGAAEIKPRVERLIRDIARRAAGGAESILDYKEMLEFLASRIPSCWPEVAQLFAEDGSRDGRLVAKLCLRRYIESGDRSVPLHLVWRSIADLAERTGELTEAVHAAASSGLDENVTLDELCITVPMVNRLLAIAKREGASAYDPEERKAVLVPLIGKMERNLDRLDATDLSGLAWLYLNVGNDVRASELVRQSLESDPENPHSLRLLARGVGR
jgi:energy-coupling factor transporter ATP-binding protein EcfA2